MKKLLIILLLVAFVSPIDLTDEQKEQIDAFIDYLNENPNLIYEKGHKIFDFFKSILNKNYYEMFYHVMREEEEDEAKTKCYGLFPKRDTYIRKCNSLINLLIELYEDYYETIEREKKYAPYKREP